MESSKACRAQEYSREFQGCTGVSLPHSAPCACRPPALTPQLGTDHTASSRKGLESKFTGSSCFLGTADALLPLSHCLSSPHKTARVLGLFTRDSQDMGPTALSQVTASLLGKSLWRRYLPSEDNALAGLLLKAVGTCPKEAQGDPSPPGPAGRRGAAGEGEGP